MALENPISNNNPTPNAEDKSTIQPDNSVASVPPTTSASKLPPSHCQYEITCKTEKDWWDKNKRWVEMAGAILLAIYTTFTILMYCANNKAANAAKKAADIAACALHENQRQFNKTLEQMTIQTSAQTDSAKAAVASAKTAQKQMILDQRAWVGLGYFQNSIYPVPYNPQGTLHDLSFPARNTGRTPARNVKIYGAMLVDFDGDCGSSIVSDPAWMKKVTEGQESGTLNNIERILNAPHPPFSVTFERFDPSYFPTCTKEGARISPRITIVGVMPPEFPFPVSFGSISISGGPQGTQPRASVVIFGEITYKDIWGYRRETQFCEYTTSLNFEPFGTCPTYNDVH